jgi:recombinational DNA repair ATPase RecF
MEIRRLWLKDYKGVETSMSVRSFNVFFGRNDSGKSNILEAVAATIGWGGYLRQTIL